MNTRTGHVVEKITVCCDSSLHLFYRIEINKRRQKGKASIVIEKSLEYELVANYKLNILLPLSHGRILMTKNDINLQGTCAIQKKPGKEHLDRMVG